MSACRQARARLRLRAGRCGWLPRRGGAERARHRPALPLVEKLFHLRADVGLGEDVEPVSGFDPSAAAGWDRFVAADDQHDERTAREAGVANVGADDGVAGGRIDRVVAKLAGNFQLPADLDDIGVVDEPGVRGDYQVERDAVLGHLLTAPQQVEILTFLAAAPLTWAVSSYQFKGRRLAMALVTVPFVLPTVVVGTAFMALGWRDSVWAILAAHVFFNVAVVVRTVSTLWSRIDPRLHEAARVLGASEWEVFKRVSLPLLRPAMAAAASTLAIPGPTLEAPWGKLLAIRPEQPGVAV
jgi:hypothetical protein